MPTTTFNFRLSRRPGFRSTANTPSRMFKDPESEQTDEAAGLYIGVRSQESATPPLTATSPVAIPPAAPTPSQVLEQGALQSDDADDETPLAHTIAAATMTLSAQLEKGASADA